MDRKKLSSWTKIKYGVGDFGMSLVSAMLSFSMLFYYTDVVGVNPGLAGTAMLVGKLCWDMVNDVLFVLSSNGLIASSLSINHSFNSSVVIL